MVGTIKILFLAAEAEPFIKIGGLADVAGSLPLALRALSSGSGKYPTLDVRLVLPLHRAMRGNIPTMRAVAEFHVPRSGGDIAAQVYEMRLGGMPVYFINGDPLSIVPSVYSTDPAPDREKYAFFSLAAMELAHQLDWIPDIVHANDWHTSLALYSLRSNPTDPSLASIRTVFTIHNLPYMGGEASDVLTAYHLKPLADDSLPKWAQTQPLPLGLWSADAIVPVSPTYGREILSPEYGCGLDPYLNICKDRMTGILNGLDVISWNPEKDQALAARYTTDDLIPRAINKKTLQKAFELKEDGRIPLLIMIGRIDQQKGLDICFESLRQMTDQNWQFVLLGSGDQVLEKEARKLQEDFPDRARMVIRYDPSLARLLYSGADMFLMPSRYEPCGLAQMIAMHYGCVPVVSATGGLKDTVREGVTGFLFQKGEIKEMMDGMRRALSAYEGPERWQHLQRNGMKEDFSWTRSANQYAAIYHSLMSGL
jgi:starch synthase